MFDWSALFYAWAGAQIAVLPVEVPILVFVLILKREVAQLVALRQMAPDLSLAERLEVKDWTEEMLRVELKKRRERPPPPTEVQVARRRT